jgi:hypothetical protein
VTEGAGKRRLRSVPRLQYLTTLLIGLTYPFCHLTHKTKAAFPELLLHGRCCSRKPNTYLLGGKLESTDEFRESLRRKVESSATGNTEKGLLRFNKLFG